MLLKLTFSGSAGRCAFLHSCYCCVCTAHMLADPSVMSGLFCPMCLHMQLHPVLLNACGARRLQWARCSHQHQWETGGMTGCTMHMLS